MANTTLTPLQGRVLYHIERLFRSTGAGQAEHQVFLAACEQLRIPTDVEAQTPAESLVCLALIEQACHAFGMHNFRDCDTQWRGLAVGGTSPPLSWEDYFDQEVRENQYFPTPYEYQQYLNHHKEQQ